MTQEVNANKNFARLRQIYNSLILATWFKKKIKESLLAQVYADKNKIAGVNIHDPQEKQKIYKQYLRAFKKGAFNYIKEEKDPVSQEVIPRKYFSGGVDFAMADSQTNLRLTDMVSRSVSSREAAQAVDAEHRMYPLEEATIDITPKDRAQNTEVEMAEPQLPGLVNGASYLVRPKVDDARSEVFKALKEILGESNDRLMNDIMRDLDAQQTVTETMSFLPPNLSHVQRALENARIFLQSQNLGFSARIAQEFDVSDSQAQRIAAMAIILLKIGYGQVPPKSNGAQARDFYKDNRKYALEKLKLLINEGLLEALGLETQEQKDKFIETIKRAGTYGVEPNYDDMPEAREGKYESSLISLVTLATDIDIGRQRLQDWQQSKTIMDALFKVLFDPEVTSLYTQRTNLEIEKINSSDPQRQAEINKEIEANRLKLNEAIKKQINENILSKEKVLVEQMHLNEGLLAGEANFIFQHLHSSIHAITSDSYLWIIGSYFIKDVVVGPNSTIKLEIDQDRLHSLGAAVNAEGLIKDYHAKRLASVINEINRKQKIAINIQKKPVYEDPRLRQAIMSMLKSETHAHLNMSVSFDSLWRIILEQQNIEGRLQKSAENLKAAREAAREAVREQRGLSQDQVDARVDDLTQWVEHLQSTLEQIRTLVLEIRKSRGNTQEDILGKDNMVREAESYLKRNVDILSQKPEHRIRLTKLIEAYYRYKTEFKNLYNYRAGPLTSFVRHFMATADIIKAMGLPAIVQEALLQNQRTNVVYVEQRFNIGKDTKEEIIRTLEEYRKFKEQGQQVHQPVPMLSLILSLTKYSDDINKSFEKSEERESRRTESVKGLLNFMKEVVEKVLAQGIDAEFEPGTGVTNRMIIEAGLSLDAAGQEEYNEPALFYKAFTLYQETVKSLNDQLQAYYGERGGPTFVGGTTFHVSESFNDVSPETGMVNTLRAMFMDDIDQDFDWSLARPVLKRLGHSLAPWLYDYDQFLHKIKTERLSERIKMIKTAINLLQLGIPLLGPVLDEEWKLLGRERPEGKVFNAQELIKTLQDVLEKRLQQPPNTVVTYVYDKDRVQDLKTIAGFVRDVTIKTQTVTEANPTSNVGVSPYIFNYETHPIIQLLGYRYADWTRSLTENPDGTYTFAGHTLSKKDAETLRHYQGESSKLKRNHARFTINTDDLTVFGTDLNEELYRIAVAQRLTIGQVAQIVQEGFDSRFSNVDLPEDVQAKVRQQYIQNTKDTPYESLEQSLKDLPEAIQVKLWELGSSKTGMRGARGIMNDIRYIYEHYMRAEDAQGHQRATELLTQNYHNYLHNLMVLYSMLKLTDNAGLKRNLRDLKVAFLGALLHDFHVRFVTVKGRNKATPALVEETLKQLEDLLLGIPYTGKRTDRNNSAYSLMQEDSEFPQMRDRLRNEVQSFLGKDKLEDLWPEIKTLILRTDFPSDVPPPSFKEDRDLGVQTRQVMERMIEDSHASDEGLNEALDYIQQQFAQRIRTLEQMPETEKSKIETSIEHLNRVKGIQVEFLKGLKAVADPSRRMKVYHLSLRLEMADQSAAVWMGTERVVEQITNGLAHELDKVGVKGNYMFFYKPALLNPRALHILQDLPLDTKINFYKNVAYFAHLTDEGRLDWEGDGKKVGFKNIVLVSLGLYTDENDKILPIPTRPQVNVQATLLVLLNSLFGQGLDLWQLHNLVTQPNIKTKVFKAGEMIFEQGKVYENPDDRDDVLFTIQGDSAILKGQEQVVRQGPGVLLGEIAAVEDTPRSASVQAVTDVSALRIPRTLFYGLYLANPRFRVLVHRLIVDRLKQIGQNPSVTHDRLNPVDTQMVWHHNGWVESKLPENESRPSLIQRYRPQMPEIIAGVFDYVNGMNNQNKYLVSIPHFKINIVTRAGRHISIYQDPVDGELILTISHKFFEGTPQEIISRIGWALYHQLLYLTTQTQRTHDKHQQILAESVLLVHDLLVDQTHGKIEEALKHLDFLIQQYTSLGHEKRDPADESTLLTLQKIKALYEAFKNQDGRLNGEVIDTVLTNVLRLRAQGADFQRIRDSIVFKLKESGIRVDDRAMHSHPSKTGGIDLTQANQYLEIKGGGQSIKFHIDPARLAVLKKAAGFVPVVINIQPLSDIKAFLGLSSERS